MRCRVVVATHPVAQKKSRIGDTRNGVVYELFFTHLPQDAFTASDVVAGIHINLSQASKRKSLVEVIE